MTTTITVPSSDFTNRDFESWVTELRSRVTSAFPGWTDFNTANFGNLLLEMFAHTLDVLSFTQDQQHLERFVIWARLRRSMIWLGKNLGFDLPGPVPATTDLEFTIADGNARVKDLVIPAGTVLTTEEGDVEFDLIADVTIAAGLIQVTGQSARNSRLRTESFIAPGTADLSVPLGFVPYVDDSAVITIGVDTWEEVDSFFNSGPSDKHFVISVDEDDRATMLFGDGINGAIPLGSGSAEYQSGGGSSGNVDANTLTVFRDSSRFLTTGGESVGLTVRNPSGGSGGVDRMSVEEARVAMPAHVRTSGQRSVTRSDFEDNARKVRGVARAMLLTSDDDGSIDENTGKLYIVPVGGGLPSTELKDDVADFINDEYPPTITFTFSVEDPSLKIINISATVYLARNVSESDARAAIETAITDLFSLIEEDGSPNEDVDFGFKIRKNVMAETATQGEFAWSDIFNAVRDAATPAGKRVLRKIEEDSVVPIDDVLLNDTEFAVRGVISLVNGDTGLNF